MVSPMEFYLTCKAQDNSSKWEEINSCCICMCPLFDDIDEDKGELMQQIIKEQKGIKDKVEAGDKKFFKEYQAVGLPKCLGNHMYHKDCLLEQKKNSKGQFITCAVCEVTYGVRTGGMPNGQMTWGMSDFDLPGYPARSGCIQFSYSFPSGT